MKFVVFAALLALGMANSHSDVDSRNGISDEGQGDNRAQMDDGDGDRSEGPERPSRIWAIGIGRNAAPHEFLDIERGMVVGLGMDMMHEACSMANQHCQFVHFKNYTDCWDSLHGYSTALSNRWFDACVNYNPTLERSLVYSFTRHYTQEAPNALYVRLNDDLNIEDIMRTGNDIPFGFRRGFWLNADCLRRHGIMVNEDSLRMYDSRAELMEALRMGQIRVGFTVPGEDNENLFRMMDTGDMQIRCSNGGNAVMARKDNVEFIEWMDRAIGQVMRSPEYARMCYIWHQVFGRDTRCLNPREMNGDDDDDMMGGNGPPDRAPAPPM